MEIRKINYNGSSYMLTIPPAYAKAMSISLSSQVVLEMNEDKQLIVTPLLRRLKSEKV